MAPFILHAIANGLCMGLLCRLSINTGMALSLSLFATNLFAMIVLLANSRGDVSLVQLGLFVLSTIGYLYMSLIRLDEESREREIRSIVDMHRLDEAQVRRIVTKYGHWPGIPAHLFSPLPEEKKREILMEHVERLDLTAKEKTV